MADKTLGGPKQDQAAATSMIQRPDWVRKPTGDDVAWVYPERAQRLELGGKAVIACDVNTQGALTGCRVVSEDPPGEGFGDAALKLAKQFQMTPSRDPDHLATVTIPIVFKVPESETLADLVARQYARTSDWAGHHHLKAPPPTTSIPISLALGLLLVAIAIRRNLRRKDDAKELSGPNSERRR